MAFDSVGLPEIAFAIGLRTLGSGLPLPSGGILAAPPFGEERLLSVVAAFQAVTTPTRSAPPTRSSV